MGPRPRHPDPFPFIFHGPEIAVRLFGFSHQLFSFPFWCWERDKRTLRADQLSRGRSRNESLSNKQSTWWRGRERECNKKNKQKEAKIYTRAINLYEEQWTQQGKRQTLARLLLSGACRQSKIINTPNFEKWLKKLPLPFPTSRSTFRLRLIKINTSIKCEYAKPSGGERTRWWYSRQRAASLIFGA